MRVLTPYADSAASGNGMIAAMAWWLYTIIGIRHLPIRVVQNADNPQKRRRRSKRAYASHFGVAKSETLFSARR